MEKDQLFPLTITVENKIKMFKTSSDILTRRTVISHSSGWIYEDKMKLEMYTALESETRIELPGLEQPDDCFPLGGGGGGRRTGCKSPIASHVFTFLNVSKILS